MKPPPWSRRPHRHRRRGQPIHQGIGAGFIENPEVGSSATGVSLAGRNEFTRRAARDVRGAFRRAPRAGDQLKAADMPQGNRDPHFLLTPTNGTCRWKACLFEHKIQTAVRVAQTKARPENRSGFCSGQSETYRSRTVTLARTSLTLYVRLIPNFVATAAPVRFGSMQTRRFVGNKYFCFETGSEINHKRGGSASCPLLCFQCEVLN
jgi:hypothetical protein